MPLVPSTMIGHRTLALSTLCLLRDNVVPTLCRSVVTTELASLSRIEESARTLVGLDVDG